MTSFRHSFSWGTARKTASEKIGEKRLSPYFFARRFSRCTPTNEHLEEAKSKKEYKYLKGNFKFPFKYLYSFLLKVLPHLCYMAALHRPMLHRPLCNHLKRNLFFSCPLDVRTNLKQKKGIIFEGEHHHIKHMVKYGNRDVGNLSVYYFRFFPVFFS